MNGAYLTSFDPQSPGAQSIFSLWIIALYIFAFIFVVVGGLIVYAVIRYRWREGESVEDPAQIAGNRNLEIIWTAIPVLIVIVLAVLTVRTMGVSDPPPAPDPDLIVTGHQWWWAARYPKSGVVTANEFHIAVGKPYCVLLKSDDVLHEFWVAELGRKITAVPGHPNHLWIQADRPGTYLGVCTEFCGTQHAWMRFLIVAEDAATFEAWQQAQLRPAPAPPDGPAAQGLAVFQKASCAACHAIGGTLATAQVAPDLTHLASRRQLGAGIAKNTPENLRRWLEDPQKVKPGVLMPDFKLTPDQVSQLVAYFETLK